MEDTTTERDFLFIGPTRPVLTWGVPSDYLVGTGFIALSLVVLKAPFLYCVTGWLLVFALMRVATEYDGRFPRVLQLRYFGTPVHLNRWFWGCRSYEP